MSRNAVISCSAGRVTLAADSHRTWALLMSHVVDDSSSAGLMTLAAAKSFGATSLTITDISPQNIALAKKMGATNAYCHSRTATPQEIADYLKKMLLPYGPEIVIDCVGFESTVQTAVRSCCMGGKVVVVGMGQDNMTLPMSTVGVHELDVLGCFRYANTVSCCLMSSFRNASFIG